MAKYVLNARRARKAEENIQWYYRIRMLKSSPSFDWCRSRRQMSCACDLQNRRVRKTAHL